MKMTGTVLDLDSSDYSPSLDPSYTLLEFDNLRVFPVESAMAGTVPSSYWVTLWWTTRPKRRFFPEDRLKT